MNHKRGKSRAHRAGCVMCKFGKVWREQGLRRGLPDKASLLRLRERAREAA